MNSWNSWNSWNSFRWNLLFVERFFVLQQACCLDSATFRAFRHNGLGVITLDVNVNCLLCPLLGRSVSFQKHKYPPTASTDPVCRPFQYFHYHQMNAGKNKATKKQITKETLNAIHLWISLFANLWGNVFNYLLVTRALNTTNREIRSRSRSESLLRPDHRLLATMIIRDLLFNLFTFNYCYIVLHTKESLITMILFSSFAR